MEVIIDAPGNWIEIGPQIRGREEVGRGCLSGCGVWFLYEDSFRAQALAL